MSSRMVLERIFAHETEEEDEEEEGEFSSQESKRPRSFLNVVREVMRLQSMTGLLLELEPFLRKVVREEVQKGLLYHVNSNNRISFNQIRASVTRRWQLRFKNKLPHTLFTGSRIEAEDSTPLQIVLTDSSSKMIITSGFLSSIRVEILVLDGDFGGEEQECWMEKEFSNSVVREREGRRPLLTGDLVATLSGGIGNFGDVTFTDNSSWIRSRKFRLGVRVFQSNSSEEIQEAISGAFFVKDHRGELHKKHHPPSLGDEVWRLEKIGRDGAFHRRLTDHGIKTVQDFLKLLVMDEDRLRSILGNGMSNKIWEATVQHAWDCVLENNHYSYYIAGQQVMLVFNSIFQIVGAQFDGYKYQPLSELTAPQKVLVNRLKHLAYENPNDMFLIDELPVEIFSRPLPIADAASAPGPSLLVIQNPDFSIGNQGEQTTQMDFKHPVNPLHNVSEDPCQMKDIATLQGLQPVQRFSSFSTNNCNLRNFSGGMSRDYGINGWGSISNEPFTANTSVVEMLSFYSLSPASEFGNGLFQSGSETQGNPLSPVPGFGVHLSPSKWVKLMATLKCGMLIRKRVAARRRARILHLGYQTHANFHSSV